MKHVLIALLRLWQLVVSPLYGSVCRYYPSCSSYALRAVQYHGAWRGSWLAARRLLSCHPWSPGGYDPVRGTPEFDEEMRAQRISATTMGAETEVGQHDHEHKLHSENEPQEEESHDQRGQEEKVAVAQGRGAR